MMDSTNDLNITNEDLAANLSSDFILDPDIRKKMRKKRRSRMEGFFEELEKKNDLEFFKMCRVTKKTFHKLAHKIGSHEELFKSKHPGGRVPVSAKLSLCVTLWYLGNQCSLKDIAFLFGLSNACIYKHITLCLDLLIEMAPSFISWPTATEAPKVEEDFRKISNFPGVIGALGSMRIPTKAPEWAPRDFMDKKKRTSMNLLAVCDASCKFMYIAAGFPGKIADQVALAESTLGEEVADDPAKIFYNDQYHLLGHRSVGLETFLMVPYDECADNSQRLTFNASLSATRSTVDHSLMMLKSRFRRLRFIDANVTRIPRIIVAACVLHNITLDSPDENNFLLSENVQQPEQMEMYPVDPVPITSHAGMAKRDWICNSFSC